MTTLFWMDSPQPLESSWSMERVERCLAQIWTTASCVAERGIPCVLDIGLGQAASRARVVKLAGQAGLSVQLHVVDAPAEERWRRVEARNAGKGDTYQSSVRRHTGDVRFRRDLVGIANRSRDGRVQRDKNFTFPDAPVIWGMPFFYGKTVYLGYSNRTTPSGPGPFVAF